MEGRKSPFDRFCDWLDESLEDQRAVPEPVHQWWIVTSSTDTGTVVTDHARCIIIAPLAWNRFIGMTLDVLLERAHANAVKIPGPYARKQWHE